MLALSGAPSTTSHLDINILSILHYLGSPLGLCTLIFDLMMNLFIYYACIFILLYTVAEWGVFTAWHSYVAALWSKCHYNKQVGSRYDLSYLKST